MGRAFLFNHHTEVAGQQDNVLCTSVKLERYQGGLWVKLILEEF